MTDATPWTEPDWRAYARELEATLAAVRRERDRLAASRRVPELDNHHNALACGYCSGPLKERAEAVTRIQEIVNRSYALGSENFMAQTICDVRAALAVAPPPPEP